MQQTTGVAVLATHLAANDRRALSQAWYSALHLAERTARPAPGRNASSALATARGADALPRGARESPSVAAAGERRARVAQRAAQPRRDASACDAERRAPKTELAGRIERALARRLPGGAPASFAVRTAGGRIHLVVRCDGARTRVVAVCAPPLRERVERAVAHARFALAGCGLRAEVA